jgi:hypothetical protein
MHHPKSFKTSAAWPTPTFNTMAANSTGIFTSAAPGLMIEPLVWFLSCNGKIIARRKRVQGFFGTCFQRKIFAHEMRGGNAVGISRSEFLCAL